MNTAVNSTFTALAAAMAAHAAALGVPFSGGGDSARQLVYDLQPLGYYRLGKAEQFRDELRASSDPMAAKFLKGLPDYWLCQDGDEHVDMSVEQQLFQDFNCANFKATTAMLLGAGLFWEKFGDATIRHISPETDEYQDERLIVDGKTVGVFASDTPARGRFEATVNPRAADVGTVLRAAYARYVLTNGTRPMPRQWQGNPPSN